MFSNNPMVGNYLANTWRFWRLFGNWGKKGKKGVLRGQKIIQKLAEDLQKEFPKNSGFSYANLDRMRKFYLTYKDILKLAQLVREIPYKYEGGRLIYSMQNLKLYRRNGE